MRKTFFKIVNVITMFALLSFAFYPYSILQAASLTSAKNTMANLTANETSDHTITFTLPSGINFDSATNTDVLRIDFPHSSAFTQTGTWVTGDFIFNDGTARVVEAVAQGAGIVDCTVTSGLNNVCVAIDTTNHIFTIKPAATYTASANGAVVTFTIDGTTTDGTLTNPVSAGSYSIDYAMCDETASCTTAFSTTHNTSVAVGVADSDQVTVTATVNSSLTFDLDVGTAGTENTNAPYSVPIGTIGVSDVEVSGVTDGVNRIMMDLNTNAGSGVVVTVRNANGANGLVSTSVPANNINSADGVMAAGTENYGLCVISVAATTGTLTKASPYDTGTCVADGNTNNVQALTTTGENLVSSTGSLAAGRAQVAVNAAVSGVTSASTDYADTLTFLATATF